MQEKKNDTVFMKVKVHVFVPTSTSMLKQSYRQKRKVHRGSRPTGEQFHFVLVAEEKQNEETQNDND